jgi:hypothetical protein
MRRRFGTDFGGQLAAFAEKAGATLDEAHRQISIAVFTDIIDATPVKTGLAVTNWQPSMGAPVPGVNEFADPTRSYAKAAVLQTIQPDASQKAWLTNNLYYIIELEYGRSKEQAPFGMVRINIAKWKTIVRGVAARMHP